MHRKEAGGIGCKDKQSRVAEMPELLAPAGGIEAFEAAVEKGADAVYVGLEQFNARGNAANFKVPELRDAVKYAHLRGVKVYLTLNTLIRQDELEEAVQTAKDAASCNIDAVIVQDIGLASAISELIPDMPIHASTQMTVYNREGAEMMRRLGFSRVILSREATLSDIRDICENVDIEVETFVHGAVCISYSGQCLMSSLMLGRSGNRGRCAQMCRLPWSIDGNSGSHKYAISPKDMCLADRLRELADAGVSCIKIEGRMKTPEYVGAVTEVYRRILDRNGEPSSTLNITDAQDELQLMKAFNRNGFTRLYCDVTAKEGKPGMDMMSADKPKNWGIPIGTVIGGRTFSDRLTGKSICLAEIRLTYDLAMGDGIEFRSSAAGDDAGGVVSEIIRNGNHVKEASKGQTVLVGRFSDKVYPGTEVYKTSDVIQNERIIREVRKHLRKMPVTGRLIAAESGTAEFTVECGNIAASAKANIFEYTDMAAADTDYLSRLRGRIETQLGKMGNTPFCLEKLSIDIGNVDPKMKLSVAAVNGLRRDTLEKLEQNILDEKKCFAVKNDKHFEKISKTAAEYTDNVCICVYNDGKTKDLDEEADYGTAGANCLILSVRQAFDGTGSSIADAMAGSGKYVRYRIPAISKGSIDRLLRERPEELKAALQNTNCDGIICGNIGQAYLVEICHAAGKKVVADYNMNIFNLEAARRFFEMGFDSIMPSIEAEDDADFVTELCRRYPNRVELRGNCKAVLMTSDYCPIGAEIGGKTQQQKCRGVCAEGRFFLKDSRGRKLEIKCDPTDCRVRIISEAAVKNKSIRNGIPFGCAAIIVENYD